MRALLVVAVLAGLVGCGWNHAPGYAGREAMTELPLPSVKGQLCQPGACDLQGPLGVIRVSNVSASVVNGDRRETKFQIDYQNASASCFGPAATGNGDQTVPLACKIGSSVLAVQPGCTAATFTESATTTYPLRTDVVTVLGHHAPGREVTLSDGLGVLALTDAPSSFDRVLYTRPGSYITAQQMLALLAIQTFVQMEGHPSECID